MKHFISLLIYALLIISSATVQAQDKSWNLLLEKVVARYIGFQVYETDSFYIVVGTSIDTFGTSEQGFSISKVDKKKGSLVATIHYEEHGVLFDFNRSRNGYLIDNAIIFPQITNTLPALIKLFKVNIRTLKIETLLSMPPPDSTSKYTMFLYDFIHINHKYYMALDYVTGIFDTPSFKVHCFFFVLGFIDQRY